MEFKTQPNWIYAHLVPLHSSDHPSKFNPTDCWLSGLNLFMILEDCLQCFAKSFLRLYFQKRALRLSEGSSHFIEPLSTHCFLDYSVSFVVDFADFLDDY